MCAVKGYLRKGGCLVAMKELSRAASAYQKALDLDPNCQVSDAPPALGFLH